MDCVDFLRNEPNASADLVIADPPYFKVLNQKWDYEWKTLDDYVEWTLT
jgi:DNA modification methylase